MMTAAKSLAAILFMFITLAFRKSGNPKLHFRPIYFRFAGIFAKDYINYNFADRSFADADFDYIYNNDNSGNDNKNNRRNREFYYANKFYDNGGNDDKNNCDNDNNYSASKCALHGADRLFPRLCCCNNAT